MLRSFRSGNSLHRAAEASALLVLCLLGVVVLGLIGSMNTGTAGLAAGSLLAVLPVPLYVLLALWIDRHEKEPLSILALAFLWGATGAALFSLLLNSLSAEVIAALSGTPGDAATVELATSVLAAPVVEETAKAAALLLLFFWKTHEFDNVIDGILYATMVGLGFAMTENISYYGEALQRGPEAFTTAFVVRGLLTPFAHPFFTAMTGIGLGLARESEHRLARLVAPPAGLASAVFIHAVWNFLTGFGMVFFGAYALVMVPAFLGVLGLILYAQRRERRIIRAHLVPCLENGVLGEAEVDALCRSWGRTRALWTAWRADGIAGWRREARLHQVASELAFHYWRLGRGMRAAPGVDAAFEAEHLEALRALTRRSPTPRP